MPFKKNLSVKTLVITVIATSVAALAVFFLTVLLGQMRVLLNRVEDEHLFEMRKLMESSLTASLENLRANTHTWSSWDEAYGYCLGENDAFIPNNLEDGTLLTIYKVEFVCIKDAEGNDLYLGSRSAPDGGQRPVFPAGLSERLSDIAKDVLENPRQSDEQALSADGPYSDTGFVTIRSESFLVCVMPVLHSDETGPAAGTFTFVIPYGDEELKSLTGMDTSVFAITEADAALPVSANPVTLKPGNIISMQSYVDNLMSRRRAILTVDHPRTIYADGWSLAVRTVITLGAGLLLVMTLLYLIFLRCLIRPLKRLGMEVDDVEQGIFIDADAYGGQQEFHKLATAINDMLDRVERSHQAEEQTKISINVLTSILNGMDAYLYVSDPVTDEILFINEKMKRHFRIPDDGVGRICWQVLQSGFDKRCEFCPCNQLERVPDVPVVWEEHNTATKRYYRNTDILIDWTDGRSVHLQHSVDITDIKMAEFALERRFRQQALMTAVTQNFIGGEDTSELILKALQMTGEFMGAALASLHKYDAQQSGFIRISEWRGPDSVGITEMPPLAAIQGDALKFVHTLGHGDIKCRTSAEIAEFAGLPLALTGTPCYMLAPIMMDGAFWGLLKFSSTDENHLWSRSDIDLSKLVANLLSGVLSRQRMEDALHRLSSIVESSPQLIAYLTPEGNISYVNPAGIAHTGYTEEELIGGGLPLIYDEKTLRLMREFVIPKTFRLGAYICELELTRKDGEKRLMAFSNFLIGGGQFIGGIGSDITEMRKLEKELISAKELAEQGSRAKGEFLSRMSHEMRTPMNAIIGMTNIAKSSNDPAKKEYCLDKIDDASRHLLGVINDILDMSKIEADKFELSVDEFNLDRMLMNVINVVQFRMDEKAQTLVLNVDPAIPTQLVGDEQRLAQVIANLLTNAVKFTPENGSVTLTVTAERERDDVILQVCVADTGIGISPEQQQRLFRSFEQADGSITRRFGGTGLGLAICKRIVELMDGRIWVDSVPEHGSTFIFTARLKKSASAPTRPALCPADLKSLNALVVDDAPEIRDYVLHVMDGFGLPCAAAADGAAALRMIERAEKPFDILFVDWMMPGMNGVQLAREVRRRETRSPIIIMISSSAWSDIQDEATSAGVNGFLPKPLFPSLIADCISVHLLVGSVDSRPPKEKSAARTFPGKTALLAEDVEINREIVITVLDGTGLAIECAEDGREAVAMFIANPGKYDIILMDMHMPNVDGLEATRMIRALNVPEAARVPIVAMTANVFKEDVERCLEAGMNDHLGKPVDFDELLEKLNLHLR